jgi:hypothetical protein
MDQQQQPEEIIRGPSTTSAKIRALAQAGYDRTEISGQLGIRYQHVRKCCSLSVIVNRGLLF